MLEIIDSYYQSVFKLYKDIVSVSSESYEKEGIDKVCELIKDFGIENGFDAQVLKHRMLHFPLQWTFLPFAEWV